VYKVGPITFVTRLWKEIGDDHVFVYASALAYSWILAVFPLFIFLLTLVSMLPASSVEGSVENIRVFLEAAFPERAVAAIWVNIEPQVTKAMSAPSRSWVGLGLLLPLALTLWAASGGVTATMAALDKCYDVENTRSFLKSRGLAMLLTIMVCGLVCVVLALWPLGAVVRSWIIDHDIPYVEQQVVLVFDITRYSLGAAAAFLILSVLYHFGPHVKQKFVLFSPGAVFCAVCCVALGWAFRQYLAYVGDASYGKTYGSLAGVAILLLIFYLYAVFLLMGAEINAETDQILTGVAPGTRDMRGEQKRVYGEIKAQALTAKAEKRELKLKEKEP
jgi:membrane protein